MENLEQIKQQIEKALTHEEAEEGLYFDNLIAVHEEEARPIVIGAEEDILDALKEMIRDGDVVVDDTGELPIFRHTSVKPPQW